MTTYSERKWIKQGETPEDSWQETGRRMTNGNGQLLIEIGKPVAQKTSKKQAVESEAPEATE